MANQTNTGVPGSGYGNVYIDALIWGNAAWVNYGAGSPIRYWFGSGGFGGSGNISAFDGPVWTQVEVNATAVALQQFSEICGLNFTMGTGPTSAGTDIIAWKAPASAVGGTTLGVHEIPNGGSNPVNGWYNYQNASWTNAGLQLGGYAYITLIHEIGHGLGLAHPHDGGSESDASQFPGLNGNSNVTGDLQMNQGIWTMMSYHDGWINAQFPGNQVSNDYGWQASPMAFDVAALQRLYGANMTTRTGADSYRLPSANAVNGVAHSFNTPNTGWFCIWDAGGVDTITNAGVQMNCTIDLRAAPLTGPNAGGYVSWIGNVDNAGMTRIFGGYTIANGVVIENAIGGMAGDVLIGNDANNSLTGSGGADTIDGQGGIDTSVYSAAAANYTLAYNNGTITVTHKNAGDDNIDTLTNIEILAFTDRSLSLAAFNPFHYLAANTDLITAWGGANTALATKHFVENGFHESRASTFNGLRYIASHADLIAALGASNDAGAQHYATNGFSEGRAITFNSLRYLASHNDLLAAFGNNETVATQHYITNGFAEGRQLNFQGLSYIASYADLIGAFGTNADIATQHYVTNGFGEGRRVTFDPFKYLASYTDLLNAFGGNTTIATQHYITNGFAEGRQLTFNGLQYTATYGDLITAFGLNSTLSTQHYVTNGFAEGRRAMFDAEFYLAKHPDLRAAFDTNTTLATQHFITNGFFEGRVSTNGGVDVLNGSNSADRLNGGASKDTMTGNGGADTFVFTALTDTTNNSATADIITDFVSGLDKIDLSGIDANTDAGGNEAFTTLIASGAAFTGPGQLRLTDGVLYGNTNSEATPEFAIVLTGVTSLTLGDFVL